MDTWVWIVIVVAVVVAALLIAMFAIGGRRRRGLQERFGPEYDRTVESSGDRRAAERDLREREERHEELDIRELTPAARDRYFDEWRVVQTRFVDSPGDAVTEADTLVQQVMRDRGYPVDDFETRAEAVSVDHPHVVENYRAAHTVWAANERGEATTEDLRQSLVHYRSLFEELLCRGAADEPISREAEAPERNEQRARTYRTEPRRPRPGSVPGRGRKRALWKKRHTLDTPGSDPSGTATAVGDTKVAPFQAIRLWIKRRTLVTRGSDPSGLAAAQLADGEELVLRRPGAGAADAVDRDTRDEARRRIRHRRELHVRPEVDPREARQELRRAPFRDARVAVDDQILLETRWVDPRTLEGDDDAGVSFDVLQLLPATEVSGHELAVLDAHPDAGDLRAPVRVERDEMPERAGLDQLTRAVGQLRHAANPRAGRKTARCSAMDRTRGPRATPAPPPTSARGESSARPCPSCEAGSGRRFAGNRDPSVGRRNTGRPSPSTRPRSVECNATPPRAEDAARATTSALRRAARRERGRRGRAADSGACASGDAPSRAASARPCAGSGR